MPALPLAQLDGVVILMERVSLMSTSNPMSCCCIAEAFGLRDDEIGIVAKIGASTSSSFMTFLRIFLL